MPREPGDGEGQGTGRRRRARAPRPSPSDLSPEERREKALQTALRLLTVRERSRAEIRVRLRGKGYEPETIEAVLDRVAGLGLQSDGRFSETFALDTRRARGLSASAIQGELRRRYREDPSLAIS